MPIRTELPRTFARHYQTDGNARTNNKPICTLPLEDAWPDAVELRLSQFPPAPRNREVLEYCFGLGGKSPLPLTKVAEKFNITKQRVSDIIRRNLAPINLRCPRSDQWTDIQRGVQSAADSLPLEKATALSVAARLKECPNAVTALESRILTLRFGLEGQCPLTQAEVASQHGISGKTVSVYAKRALTRLRLKIPTASEWEQILRGIIPDATPAGKATRELMQQLLNDFPHAVTRVERKVIEMRFGINGYAPHTQKEVEAELGMANSAPALTRGLRKYNVLRPSWREWAQRRRDYITALAAEEKTYEER